MSKKKNLKILVIENDEYIRADLVEQYKNYSTYVVEASSLEEANKKIGLQKYDVVSIDLNLSNDESEIRHDGLEVLPKAVKQNALSFILSSYKDQETIEKAMNTSSDVFYIKKDKLFGIEGIDPKIFKEQIGRRIEKLISNPFDTFFKEKFITHSELLKERIEEVSELAVNSSQKIMIKGETGVGKTFFAKILHGISEGKGNKKFVHVNASSVTSNLFESIFFGHIKGSFTGANQDQPGLFEQANGGTLFIDEIGTIPVEFQQKLLTALDPKEEGFFYYRPVGAKEDKRSKFRLITGTCDDLEALFQEGKLREDFYYRIATSEPFNIPALRDRREDILPLIEYFIENSPRAISFGPEAKKCLESYDWPGNVRQLEEFTKSLGNGKKSKIEKFDLPIYIINNTSPLEGKTAEKLFNRHIQKFVAKHGLKACIKLIEQAALKDAMEKTDHKHTVAFDMLGLSKSKGYGIYNRLPDKGASHNV